MGKKIYLIIRKRRYVCKACGKKFFEHITFIGKSQRMTNRLAAYIISQLGSLTSMKEIAKHTNVSAVAVMRLFDKVNPGQTVDEFFLKQYGQNSFKAMLLQISDALEKMTDSMQKFKDYFEGYKNTNIFYVPPGALKSSNFEKALDSYMDKSRKITKIILILDTNPYTNKAIDIVDSVEKVLKNSLKFVDAKFTEFGVGGISSSNHDLRSIYFKDFRTLRLIMIHWL